MVGEEDAIGPVYATLVLAELIPYSKLELALNSNRGETHRAGVDDHAGSTSSLV